MPKVNRGYGGAPSPENERVVVVMPKAEADAIDGWGVPAGMPNRTSAVRHLLRKGLETVKAQEARHPAG